MIYNSEHIIITRLRPNDALQLNKLLVSNTERFVRYLPHTLAANRTLESSKAYIDRKIEMAQNKTEFVLAIKNSLDKQIMGLVILKNLDWDLKQGEFAYCIGKHYKGNGIMVEAIKATSAFAREELKLETLQIISHKSNASSIKVAVNSGFKWKKTLINEFTPLNEAPVDMELYELRNEN